MGEVDVKRGLQELNPDLHFDMGTALNQWHPHQAIRQGVFYAGRHVCSMDRGSLPEYKIWDVMTAPVEASFSDADKEDVHIAFRVIDKTDPNYNELLEAARTGKFDHLTIREEDGALLYLRPLKIGKVRGRCRLVGWRHTFEALIRARIPGVTRESLAAKFGVDMYRFPVGSPDVIQAQLYEE